MEFAFLNAELVACKLDIQSNGGNTRSQSSESETCISQSSDQMAEANTKFKDVNGTKGAFPDTWRSWSLQRAGFSLMDFEGNLQLWLHFKFLYV